jgi:hypothetical protein
MEFLQTTFVHQWIVTMEYEWRQNGIAAGRHSDRRRWFIVHPEFMRIGSASIKSIPCASDAVAPTRRAKRRAAQAEVRTLRPARPAQ